VDQGERSRFDASRPAEPQLGEFVYPTRSGHQAAGSMHLPQQKGESPSDRNNGAGPSGWSRNPPRESLTVPAG
jgi:hypothetical protein